MNTSIRLAFSPAVVLGACLLVFPGCEGGHSPKGDGDLTDPDAGEDRRDDIESLETDMDAAEGLDLDTTDNPENEGPEDGDEEEATIDGYRLYYGELHGHSDVSDGMGTPEAYFTYCRDVSLLDFCALTDHNLNQPELNRAIDVADAFNTADFVAFYGSEWSHDDINHKPCYNIMTACNGENASCDTPDKLYASVLDDGGLCHAAHPAHASYYTDWSLSDDVVEVAGEIYEDEVKMNEAWRMGLKLGAVGASDTHGGTPGSKGVTGCYATGLSREEILEALRARRCFATNINSNVARNPMDVTFRIDGRWMGETLIVESGSTHTFEIVVNGTTIVNDISLKTGEATVEAEHDCSRTHCDWSGSLDMTGPAYYYVMARGSAGEIIWSSPIWIEIGD